MSEAELFDYPIKDLPDRYSVARSAVYVRMKRLNITPHTKGNCSYRKQKTVQGDNWTERTKLFGIPLS
jgi:hypothetical protein